MSDELEIYYLFMDSYEFFTRERVHRKRLRDLANPFEENEEHIFRQRYRLSKDLVKSLCDELRPLLKEGNKATDLSVENKVLIALSFYATGSYQRPTGDISGHAVAQPTVSTAMPSVTRALSSSQFLNKYIKFPQTAQERSANMTRFYNKYGMPGILGCIDGTHVSIMRPSEHEERFFCRKQYHSLDVQLISNADMKIISVDASYGGATHDSFIWGNHPLHNHLEELNSGNESVWLLGDSGYLQRKFVMTPITNATVGSPEAYYTEVHVRTRVIVEQTIGLLQGRFQCLLVHRVLHYAPQVAASIVNACVVLHNMAVGANIPVPVLTDEEAALEGSMQMNDMTHHILSSYSNLAALNEGLVAWRGLVMQHTTLCNSGN